MESIILVEHLSYTYPDGKRALQEINLQVQPGEKIALIGPNGAGKSTLLYHLNGILSGAGRIQVDGLEMARANLGRIRARVGLVFQNPDDQLFSPSVAEDVAFGPLHQGLGAAEVEVRVRQALAAVHMSGFEERSPYHLSGGEKKRVAIASVLSMQPPILVFDEPTAGLDPRTRRELIELLLALPQTMLIATHDLELARQLTPRTLLLHQGRMAADGDTALILADTRLLDETGLI